VGASPVRRRPAGAFGQKQTGRCGAELGANVTVGLAANASSPLRWMLALLAMLVSARGDQVDDFLAAQMQRSQIPGIAVAVITDGQVVKSRGYGVANLEWRVAVTPETVFEIGSLTKQFTAVCVMMLVEQGRIRLDDSIAKYLEAPAGWRAITVRHLLTHTSGLKNYNGLAGFEASKHLDANAFIQKIAAYPLAFAPGESFAYCNTGYNLLGFMIEKASGQPYWEFLSAHVLRPLGMSQTQNRDQKTIILNCASGYEKEGERLVNRDSDLTDVFSAGAMVSTIVDMAKWNAAVDSRKLLQAGSWDQIWTGYKLNNGKVSSYGFGWRLEDYKGRKNIGHSGSTSGFSASLQRFPADKLAVIVLCNSGEQNIATVLARGIADIYLFR